MNWIGVANTKKRNEQVKRRTFLAAISSLAVAPLVPLVGSSVPAPWTLPAGARLYRIAQDSMGRDNSLTYWVADYNLPDGSRYMISEHSDKKGLEYRHEYWYKTPKDHEPYRTREWYREDTTWS